MSTFVVRFVGTAPGAFRGKVRHVRTGEEGIFSSPTDLLCFFERMNASYHEDSDAEPMEEPALDPPEAGSLAPRNAGGPGGRSEGGPPS